GIATAITCFNSFAQIGFAESLRRLGDQSTDVDRERTIADFNKRFLDHVTALNTHSQQLSKALERLNQALGEIQTQQQKAKRALNTALWLLTQQAETTATVDNVLLARKETARARYEHAFKNAKTMAFLAKRAIEQRLGMSLDE